MELPQTEQNLRLYKKDAFKAKIRQYMYFFSKKLAHKTKHLAGTGNYNLCDTFKGRSMLQRILGIKTK